MAETDPEADRDVMGFLEASVIMWCLRDSDATQTRVIAWSALSRYVIMDDQMAKTLSWQLVRTISHEIVPPPNGKVMQEFLCPSPACMKAHLERNNLRGQGNVTNLCVT